MGAISVIIFVVCFLILPALAGLFVLGLFAAGRAVRARGDYARTLACLALNLCEPLATFVYIVALGFAIVSGWYRHRPLSAEVTAFLWTAPMVVLLIPVIAMRFCNRVYRLHALLTLAIGGMRWVLVWLAIYYLHLPGNGDSRLLPAVGLGIGMLWLSLF